jgi:hypothetical protein
VANEVEGAHAPILAKRAVPAGPAGDGAAQGTRANPDPITGEPGAHPLGTVVGGAAGAVAGGLGGKKAAEGLNPTSEDSYWRDNYNKSPSYRKGYTYDDYAPAYRTGYSGFERARANGDSWDKAEPSLRSEYERARASRA